MFVSVAIKFYSFALCAAKVPLRQCSRVLLLWRNSLSKLKAKVWRKNRLCHEARWFSTEKSPDSFTATCFFPQRLQRRRLSSRSCIIGNGDNLYTSILQKIIGKNLSKRVYHLLYKLWKMITCVCTDDKLLFIVHLFVNTAEKVIKKLIHGPAERSSKKKYQRY